MKILKQKRINALLGLSFDGSQLEGTLLRRTNGSVSVQKKFSATLTLDPLSNDPELVGREIRNHLEASGTRERQCAVCVPLNWALTLQTKIPNLPEADIASFLQIEAERGFPYAPESLLISTSRFVTPSGEKHAIQVAIPHDHVARLEKALRAARLKPVTFSLGISALQQPEPDRALLALVIGEDGVGIQVSYLGGIAALRTLEGTAEAEGGRKRLLTDVIARELRITLGQLPVEVRESIRRLRVFGNTELMDQFTREIRPRVEAMGLEVEGMKRYSKSDFGVQTPPDAAVCASFSLAARHLTGSGASFEFLPPKVSAWTQMTGRYSSRKLVWAGGTAGSIAALIAACFIGQQWQLSRLRSSWAAMSPKVAQLDELQQHIRKFRPWFDDSLRTMSILRRLSEAFPEDGVVSAKTVEIREMASVTCTGSARDSQALYKTLDHLRSAKEVADVNIDTIRGKAPIQFTFNFHWGGHLER